MRQLNVRNAVRAVNAVKKVIHRTSPLFLQKFTAKFTAILPKIYGNGFPTFTQSDINSQKNIKEVVGNWRSGISG